MAGKNEIEERVERLTAPGFRGRLLARGLARELIWRDGELPEGAPKFSTELTSDLLDHGFGLLRMGLSLRSAGDTDADVLDRAFRNAAEAIEAAVRNGDPGDRARGFYRVMAAAAYHLAHYSARSYCLLGSDLAALNLNRAERTVAQLMRRELQTLESESWESIVTEAVSDEYLSNSLEAQSIGEDDALQVMLNNSVVRAVLMFLDAMETGDTGSHERTLGVLDEVVDTSAELGFVTLWWLSYVTRHLIEDLWLHSLHTRIPPTLPDEDTYWRRLRRQFIGVLWSRQIGEVELWPSQLEAAERVQDATDDLVAALPTGAGKTRIAELAILRTLAAKQRVVYVTPLRSLSAQLERSLRRVFQPLGFSVSSLYGASGSTHLDVDSLKNRDIVVSTPEKLDFALRNNASLIDDVGLIVLDEGHTIGAGEREVRYEVLVQRLLRRSDSDQRRLVCLSAILPEGERLDEFVAWLRNDQPGEAIVSGWRPSRQRFGTIVQHGNHARLDIQVEGEAPYVPFFLTQRSPGPGSRRKKAFPADCSELVLASAWEFSSRLDQGVLIFCPLRRSVEKLARLVLQLHKQQMLPSLLPSAADITEALQIGKEWLGEGHPATECLKLGVAVHHAKLPKQFLQTLEALLASKVLKVVVASPTLAQGLNLSAATVIMNSIHRGQNVIKGEEFANVAGRAGRAFVDIDGQVLYPIFENAKSMETYKLRAWSDLVQDAQKRSLVSGILQVVILLFHRLQAFSGGGDKSAVLEYIANNADWDSKITPSGEGDDVERYQQQLRSLDVALLSLIEDLECSEEQVAAALDSALKNSLWSRQIKNLNEHTQTVLKAILEGRARQIWRSTSASQRRGYYFAGIGVQAGLAIDDELEELVQLITAAERGQEDEDGDATCDAVEKFAKRIFEIPPFVPDPFPEKWKKILRGWLRGVSVAELEADSAGANEFIQDGICYKLTWGLEAVRVRAGTDYPALQFTGSVTAALDVGSMNLQEILLLRAGLRSRVAATEAVNRLAPTFKTFKRMRRWLLSDEVRETLQSPDWPTAETSNEWQRFVRSDLSAEQLQWKEEEIMVPVVWDKHAVREIGGRVRIYADGRGNAHVFSLELDRLGLIKDKFARSRGPQFVVVGPQSDQVTVTGFGPAQS